MYFSVSSKRKSRSGKSCGGLRMLSQASAPVKPTTKSLSPLLPTQVRHLELPCVQSHLFCVICALQAMWLCYCISPLKHLIILSILMPWTWPMGKESTGCPACIHVHIHWIPQRGSLYLQCRRHQCLLCLGARLLWRCGCPSSHSTAPASAPAPPPPPCPPAPASNTGWTQPSPVGWNGWVYKSLCSFALLESR